MDQQQAAALVERQRAFFHTGVTLDPTYRVGALSALRETVRAHEGEIADALKADFRKPFFEAYMTETGMVLDEARYLIAHTRAWAKPHRVPTPLAQFFSRSFVLSEPYGAALIMSPWNYPFQLCIEPLLGALCAGNCAVLKPSAYAPHVSAVIRKLVGDTFEEQYVAVVEGGRAENTALLEQKFDFIFFTGSVAVGKLVMERAAQNLTPVSLELGGKSPCIVERTAELRTAARRLAFGKFLNAGQTCVAPDYLLLDAAVQEEFLRLLREETERFFPRGAAEDYPVIINDKHFARVSGLAEPEKKLFQIGAPDAATRFYPPTVLTDVSWDAPVMQEEIFGPLLPVLTYESLSDALAHIRERPKPLALYLFTKDKQVEHTVLDTVSFGGGCVNDTIIHLATSHMGFGGVGDSGMGSYHGKASFDTFSHHKSIVHKAFWPDLPFRYRPYSDEKLQKVRLFLK